MGFIGDVGQVETHFGSFEDSVNISARMVHWLGLTSIGSEIILGKRWMS
jgi:hypothetical protein